MFKTGLCSVSFRKLPPDQIIEMVASADLDAIEWGGDVHVPPGDTDTAQKVGSITRDAGLEVASYGSYLRVGAEAEPHLPDDVLASAKALRAPVIRVWAGDTGSEDAKPEDWKRCIEATRTFTAQARDAGLRVAFEYHGGTLTDTLQGTLRLLEEVDHPALTTYWQPPVGQDDDQCADDIKALRESLSWLHVFHWVLNAENQIDRRPLKEGQARWERFFQETAKDGVERYALMEFVRDDDPAQFMGDADALKAMIKSHD